MRRAGLLLTLALLTAAPPARGQASGDWLRRADGPPLLGEPAPAYHPDSLARRLLTGTPQQRRDAPRALLRLFQGAAPADSALATSLTDRLLEIVLAGAEPWQRLEIEGERPGRELFRLGGRHERRAVVVDSLPAGLAERWEGRVELLRDAELRTRARDPVLGVYYLPGVARRVGPFVRLRLDYRAWIAIRGEDAPHGYAGGTTLYLLREGEGWRLVYAAEWIS